MSDDRVSLLKKLKANPWNGMPVLAGFDAFVDNIQYVVAERMDAEHYRRLEAMMDFAGFVQKASGKSGNLEVVTQQKKAGGNAPLFSVCSSTLGAAVTTIAPVGDVVLPVFREAAPQVNWISIGEPGFTNALEFVDGKIMLGNIGGVGGIGWDTLRKKIGDQQYFSLIAQSKLVMFGNWTMLLGMGDIIAETADNLPANFSGMFFIDLADPRKRSREDLSHALAQLAWLALKARVVLGLNLSEAEQVCDVLKISAQLGDEPTQLENAAKAIVTKLGFAGVVIHATHYAAGFGGDLASSVAGPYCAQPLITTGAGDHFNGGFATALAVGFSWEESLLCGVMCSGYYVRNAKAPTPVELALFIESISL